MKITIAERLHPFSHANGVQFLLPKTAFMVQVFPARVYFTDLTNRLKPFDVAFDFVGPIKDFTAELDLEHGQLRVFGMTKKGYMRFLVDGKLEGIWLTMEKVPQEKVVCHRSFPQERVSLSKGEGMLISVGSQENRQDAGEERLSLGMHKAQEWESIRRRLDFKEIFPLWLSLCAWMPPLQGGARKVGNGLLLDACRHSVENKERETVLDAFETFFLSSFEGVLVPRLVDTEHQGIFLETDCTQVYSDRLNLSLFEQTKQSQIEANFVRAPNEEHHCQIGKGDEEDRFGRCAVVQKGTNSTDPSIEGVVSSLPLLIEGGSLIRSLFFQETQSEIVILPCLPSSFVCGRMTAIKTSRNEVVDFEWTKKFLRRVRIISSIGGELRLRLPKGISSFRLKIGRATMTKVSVDREGRAVLRCDANQILHLDRFESF